MRFYQYLDMLLTIGLVSLAYLSNDILSVSRYVVTIRLVSLAYLSNEILSVSRYVVNYRIGESGLPFK